MAFKSPVEHRRAQLCNSECPSHLDTLDLHILKTWNINPGSKCNKKKQLKFLSAKVAERVKTFLEKKWFTVQSGEKDLIRGSIVMHSSSHIQCLKIQYLNYFLYET